MKPVIYVAHPVSTGDPVANAHKAIRWVVWLTQRDPSRIYIAPWVAEVLGFAGQPLTPAFYQRVVDDDCDVVAHLDGVIGTGGEGWTKGMGQERATIRVIGRGLLDLTLYSEPTDLPAGFDLDQAWADSIKPQRRAEVVA